MYYNYQYRQHHVKSSELHIFRRDKILIEKPSYFNTRQDTRFFISGKLPIVHDYIQCLMKC